MQFDPDRPVARDAFIFYHANCPDGFGALWALASRLDLGLTTPRQLQHHAFPLDYGQDLPPIPDRAEVYFLDFCFKQDQRQILADLAARCSRVVVVDHHATGAWIEQDAPEGVEVVFDQSKSGAVLTWEAFRGGSPVPPLLQYVQDRDLWRHELPHSEAVNLAIRFRARELAAWMELESMIRRDLAVVVREGAAIMAYRDVLVRQTVESAALYELDAEGCPPRLVWMICQPSLVSDACHAALTAYPDALFAVAFVIERNPNGDKWRVGLRARNGGYNVAAIAQRFGGGGHRAAAGFSFSLPKNTSNLYLLLKWIAEAWQQIPREAV